MNTEPKALKWSVIIGIVIVLNLFFNYALSLAYKGPEFTAYCPNTQVIQSVDTQEQCVAKGGQWNANIYGAEPKMVVETKPAGYCDLEYTCRQNYEEASKKYDRNVFVILVILGALSVLVGTFIKSNYVVSQGLAFAGVLSFIIASMRYWSRANDLIHVIILGIALALLIFVAYKKFKN